MATSLQNKDIYSVSRLNRESKCLLSDYFSQLWIAGEISNFTRPSSGHFYFTLKDSDAQVRCAMFRSSQRSLKFQPANGLQVLLKAQVSLYEARGDYQLIVESMQAFGEGVLQRAFEALKLKLASEGLFDSELKKKLPPLPQRIGVITSATGAAVHDILTVLQRRFAAIPVLLFPVPVQGEQAAAAIAAAIHRADQCGLCDVLVVVRGGGSLEDLWAFNEEVVARAIHACTTPVVTGVGHEVDFTIADLVADVRAATPSVAAETVAPDQQQWLAVFQHIEIQLQQQIQTKLKQQMQTLAWMQKRLHLQHPGSQLQNQAQRLDELKMRLKRALQEKIQSTSARLAMLNRQLMQHNPILLLKSHQSQLDFFSQRLQVAIEHRLQWQQQKLSALSRGLDAVSPLSTLSRGYAIVSRLNDGEIVRSYKDVQVGEQVYSKLSQGRLLLQVEKVMEK